MTPGNNTDNAPERPRAEPEIIPPNRRERPSDWRNPPWQDDPFGQTRGAHRVYVTRVGPFGVALFMLAVALILAFVFITAFGLILIWIPVVAVVVIAAALLRLLRGSSSR
jgi:hypothetical protein